MVFEYSKEYLSKHVFDAAYMCSGSYADAYFTILLLHGKNMAIYGYKEHLKTRHELTQYDVSLW